LKDFSKDFFSFKKNVRAVHIQGLLLREFVVPDSRFGGALGEALLASHFARPHVDCKIIDPVPFISPRAAQRENVIRHSVL